MMVVVVVAVVVVVMVVVGGVLGAGGVGGAHRVALCTQDVQHKAVQCCFKHAPVKRRCEQDDCRFETISMLTKCNHEDHHD